MKENGTEKEKRESERKDSYSLRKDNYLGQKYNDDSWFIEITDTDEKKTFRLPNYLFPDQSAATPSIIPSGNKSLHATSESSSCQSGHFINFWQM